MTNSPQQDSRTTLKFLQWQELYAEEKPFQIFINLPENAKDRRATNLVWEDIPKVVKDVRGSEDQFRLDDQGFTFVRSPSKVVDFSDRDIIERQYLPEVEDLIRREVEGVDRVFFFDWRLRKNTDIGEEDTIDLNNPMNWLQPAESVHVDQSTIAVVRRIRLQLPDDAERLLSCRIRVINVWRPVGHPVEDMPLALCDGSTVQHADLIESDHIRRHYVGSTMYLLNRHEHRWHYLSFHSPDEVLLFKNFDSSSDVKAKYAPHGAFRNDNVRPGAKPRESIETRALVFTY